MPPYIKYSKTIKVVFFIFFMISTAHADYLSDYENIYNGKITDITSPITFTTAANDEYKIASMYIDKELSKEVYDYLNNNLKNNNVSIYKYKNASKDRYGRYSVIVMNNSKSLQEALISKKLATIYIEDDDNDFINHLKSLSNPKTLSAKDAPNILKYINNYKVVTGKITDFKETKKSIYLNFDTDWKNDFTIRIDKNYWKKIKDSYYTDELTKLIGKEIMVRGFVENYYGPMIDVKYKQQLDIKN